MFLSDNKAQALGPAYEIVVCKVIEVEDVEYEGTSAASRVKLQFTFFWASKNLENGQFLLVGHPWKIEVNISSFLYRFFF